MLLKHGLHLAYCTNVHRGESWAETFAALEQHTLRVKATAHALGDYEPLGDAELRRRRAGGRSAALPSRVARECVAAAAEGEDESERSRGAHEGRCTTVFPGRSRPFRHGPTSGRLTGP